MPSKRLSLGEVESLSSRAARGFGFDWGTAEEVGYSARILAQHGFDSAGLLTKYLMSDVAMQTILNRTSQPAAQLGQCPFICGIGISDFYLTQSGLANQPVCVNSVRFSAFLLPFLSRLSTKYDVCIKIDIGTHLFYCDQGLIGTLSETEARFSNDPNLAPNIVLTKENARVARITARKIASLNVSEKTITMLEGWMHRTLVPASDASRQGAEAAGSDNL